MDRMPQESPATNCRYHGAIRLPSFPTEGSDHVPIILEIIPPPVNFAPEEQEAMAQEVARLSAPLPLTAFNIPEVRNETRSGARTNRFVPKIEPRKFAKMLKKAYLRMGADCPERIVNRCVPYLNAGAQRRWFLRTHREFGIHSFVLVGPEKSSRRYVGPGVEQAAQMLRALQFPALIGAITIPTRRSKDPELDEPARMLRKLRAGIQFFTSQILMEPDAITRLLNDYTEICNSAGVLPAPVFLGIAPVAKKEDIYFMKWLGVEIPQDTEHRLLSDLSHLDQQSLALAEEIVATVLHRLQRDGIHCGIGILVEHVMQRNFELSVELTRRVAKLVGYRLDPRPHQTP